MVRQYNWQACYWTASAHFSVNFPLYYQNASFFSTVAKEMTTGSITPAWRNGGRKVCRCHWCSQIYLNGYIHLPGGTQPTHVPFQIQFHASHNSRVRNPPSNHHPMKLPFVLRRQVSSSNTPPLAILIYSSLLLISGCLSTHLQTSVARELRLEGGCYHFLKRCLCHFASSPRRPAS